MNRLLNLKRGYKRLAVVFFCTWLTVWGCLIGKAFLDLNASHRAYDISRYYYSASVGRNQIDPYSQSEANEDRLVLIDNQDRLKLYFEIALAGLVVLPLSLGAIIWIRHGFSPDISN